MMGVDCFPRTAQFSSVLVDEDDNEKFNDRWMEGLCFVDGRGEVKMIVVDVVIVCSCSCRCG